MRRRINFYFPSGFFSSCNFENSSGGLKMLTRRGPTWQYGHSFKISWGMILDIVVMAVVLLQDYADLLLWSCLA